ncbi:MAG: family transporter protein [Gemmataceae bacterium]|nr:family transporter protein [Gemmataceae bacterium]
MIPVPTAIRTVRWMVRDTFRQSLSTKLFWVMLGLTGLCTLFCLGVSVDAPPERPRAPGELPLFVPRQQATPEVHQEGIFVPEGKVRLGFGLVEFDIVKSRADSVRLVQLWLAGILADTAGVLLALLWTAGFLPTFLEPNAVTVLLAKPAPRWAILAGKYLGVVLFVGVQAVVFVAGTWFGLGFATGVWDGAYWFAVPLLVVNFAVFYAASALLAVCTRSTVVSVFGTLLFWVLCWAMNFTHHRVVGFDVPGITPEAVTLTEVGYWTLPKPLDMSGIFFEAMGAKDYSTPVPELEAVKRRGVFHPELAVLTSLLFAAGVLALAAYEFRQMDY